MFTFLLVRITVETLGRAGVYVITKGVQTESLFCGRGLRVS